MSKPFCTCGVCGGQDFETKGLQWFPIDMIEGLGWVVAVTDCQRPCEGAVRLLICTQCQNSYVEGVPQFKHSHS